MTHRRSCGELKEASIGEEVVLYGWVHRRRDHGGLIFVDLRDREGMTQVVFHPEKRELFVQAGALRPEFVVELSGEVRRRPAGMENKRIPTGQIEIVASSLTVLNSSKTPPFEIEEEDIEPDAKLSEELRLTYRYLDLRRPRMFQNLWLRHKVCQVVRCFLDERGFIEIETPILTKSTPEGARDYLVPSRLNPGKFYALPQSPQLFKQLLMVAGFERYFQISRCFRDEDLRADRQPEFTQVDIELSFPDEEDIFGLIERLLKEIFEKSLPGKKIDIPFPRMKYQESFDTYGADSPDLRFEVKLRDLTEILRDCGFERFQSVIKNGGRILAINAPCGSRLSEKQIEVLRKEAQGCGAHDIAPFKCENGSLISHLSKYFQKDSLNRVAKELGVGEGDLVIVVAHENIKKAQSALGRVRDQLKEKGYLDDVLLGGKEEECAFTWITDFPLFEEDEEKSLTSSHHPFTAFNEADRALLLSELRSDLLKVRSRAYDIVLNGIELGSGSIRIHDRNNQEIIFEKLNLSPQEQKNRFGFLLEAFTYGAPPHGGIAFGLDRLIAMLVDIRDGKLSDTGEATSIRDVIAFPKTQKAFCPMTEAPSEVAQKQLKELGISHQGGKR